MTPPFGSPTVGGTDAVQILQMVTQMAIIMVIAMTLCMVVSTVNVLGIVMVMLISTMVRRHSNKFFKWCSV